MNVVNQLLRETRFSGTPASLPTNVNRVAITTDWHVTDVTPQRTTSGMAIALSNFINSLRPVLITNFGDSGDRYGDIPNLEDLTLFKQYAYTKLIAPQLILRGNHDAIFDSDEVAPNDFTNFDVLFPEIPYHATALWEAPNVTFIAAHSEIIHTPDPLEGFWSIEQTEIDWIEDQIDAAPGKVIVCLHPPAPMNEFGNGVATTHGGLNLMALLAAKTAKILCVLGGHRHIDNIQATIDGNLHVSLGCVGYTNDTAGFFNVADFDGVSTITFTPVSARAPFGDMDPLTFPPIVLNL